MKGVLVIITGRSATGKSTLVKELIELGYRGALSVTTRPMREGEINGIDYDFVTVDEFAAIEAAGELLETNEFNGNRYGKRKGNIVDSINAGFNVACILEPKGRENVIAWAESNDITVLPIWLEVDAKIQAARLLWRFVADLFDSDEPENRRKALHAHANRLGVILSEEQSWRPRGIGIDCSRHEPIKVAEMVHGAVLNCRFPKS